VTDKNFKFAEQNNLPFYFVSAADGTNVVKVFNEALKQALHFKLNPPDNFLNDVMEFLNEVTDLSKLARQKVEIHNCYNTWPTYLY
jgi:Rab-like protein 2